MFALIGFLNKILRNYEEAICYFQKVIQIEHFNADAYAQLGNCYELQGEERAAKIMMREAFFLNPAAVDLTKLESDELHIYTLVVTRFLAALMPDAISAAMNIEAEINGEKFVAKGSALTEPGFKAIYTAMEDEDDDDEGW